jgi:multidrug efflux pump subunit AcrA (membrane-fusion protein)
MLGAGVAASDADAPGLAGVVGAVGLTEGATVEQAENTRTEITISDAVLRFNVTNESSSVRTDLGRRRLGPGIGGALHLL